MTTFEYKLVTGISELALSERVSELLYDGWVLHSGPVITISGPYSIYAQAVIKKVDMRSGPWE